MPEGCAIVAVFRLGRWKQARGEHDCRPAWLCAGLDGFLASMAGMTMIVLRTTEGVHLLVQGSSAD